VIIKNSPINNNVRIQVQNIEKHETT
jgi:hypothetical protein